MADIPATSSRAEMLYGAKAIAYFLGIERRQVYHLAYELDLPTFKVGQMVCARPDALRRWMIAQEAAGRGGA